MLETLSYKRVRARKEHTSDFCEKRILRGEEYRRSTHRDYVQCAFEELGRCYNEGLTAEDFREFMREYHPDVANEWWD